MSIDAERAEVVFGFAIATTHTAGREWPNPGVALMRHIYGFTESLDGWCQASLNPIKSALTAFPCSRDQSQEIERALKRPIVEL